MVNAMTTKELLNLYIAKYLSDPNSRNRGQLTSDPMPPGYREAYERGYLDNDQEGINSIYLQDQFQGLEDF